MKKFLLGSIFALSVAGANALVPVDSNGPAKGISLSESSGAIAAAYEALKRAHLSQNQDVLVISRQRRFIVVSFLISDADTTGRSVHVVYDPLSKKVAHVTAEQ